jgi:hypothetical protein
MGRFDCIRGIYRTQIFVYIFMYVMVYVLDVYIDFSTSVYKLNKEKNIMYFSKAIRIRATLYITMNQRSF